MTPSPKLPDPREWLSQQKTEPPRPSSGGTSPKLPDPKEWLAAQQKNDSPTTDRDSGSIRDALANEDFLHSAWNAIKSPFSFISDSVTGEYGRMAKEERARMDQLQKSGTPEQRREFAKDYLVGHIPFASTLYKLYRGNLSGAAGDAAGFAILGGATKALSETPRGARAVGRAVRGVTETDPAVGMTRAFKPTPADSNFAKNAVEARSDILTHGGPVADNATVQTSAKAAMEKAQTALERWMDTKRHLGKIADGSSIAKASEDAIPSTMHTEDPKAAAAISKNVRDAYSGKRFSVDELRQLLREKNAELDSFYDKSTGKQQASVTSGSPQSVVKAQRDAIADLLYNTLDPENQGAGPREIQRRYGAMKQLYDISEKRNNAILQEKPLSKLGAGGKAAAAFVDLVSSPFHGDTEGAVEKLLSPYRGKSDPLIKKSFKNAPPAAPFPEPSVDDFRNIVTGTNPKVKGLLGKGQINVEWNPKTDPSFVRGTRNSPAQATQAMRPALPPGTAPFTQGIVVPDIAGRPGPMTGRMLEAGQQPPVGGPRVAGVESPSTKGTIQIPMTDTSGVRSVPAPKSESIDPKTGKLITVYSSSEKPALPPEPSKPAPLPTQPHVAEAVNDILKTSAKQKYPKLRIKLIGEKGKELGSHEFATDATPESIASQISQTPGVISLEIEPVGHVGPTTKWRKFLNPAQPPEVKK